MSADGKTALDSLNFGTSTGGAAGAAETTSTLGVDRLDVRVPPDTTRIWGAQINACKNLLISMSQHFLGGTRLKMLTQSANPFGASEGGFWTDGTNAKFTNASGTTITLGSGANGLLGAYQGASATSQNILTFTSALGPVILRDNATPLGGTLFGVQNSAGSTKYIDVTSNGVAATQYSGTVYTQTFSATPTFTASNGETQLITLTANITSYTVSAGLNGQILTIIFIQDATGSRTLAGTPGNVKLGGTLTLSTAANARDSLTLRYDSTNSVWQEIGRGLSTGSGGSTVGLKAAYTGGATSADEIIGLTSSLSSVLIRDNATPIATTLFGVQSSGGGSKFLDVTTNGVQATQYFGTVYTVTYSATPTFTSSNGETQLITLTGNITSYTMTAGQAGQVMTIIFIQDATGSRTLAGTPSNTKLSGGAFTLSTAANARDSITFRYDSTNSIWEEIGRKTQAAAAGSGTVTGTGTSTQVAFWSGASALTSDSALYWDNTNKRLSINAGSSPSFKLDILGVASGGGNDFQLRVKGGTSSAGQIAIDTTSTNFQAAIQFASAGVTKWQIGKQTDDTLFLWDSANSRDILECASGNMRLCPAGGNVIVGASGTPSYMLDVHGTGGVTGLLTLTGGITGTGATAWDWSGSSSAFKTSTGAVSVNGLTTFQPSASSSGSPVLITVTGPAHTGLTASTEAIDCNFNLARTVQFATGALTTQRAAVFQAPTYGFVGASTLTTAATLAVSNAPTAGTNATITNAYAFWVQAGKTRLAGITSLGGQLALDGGVSISAGSGSGFFDFSAGTGAFSTSSGTNTLYGLTLVAPLNASTSGSPVTFQVTAPAHTTLAASTEDNDIYFNLARTVQFSTGNIATQRAVLVKAPTYGFVAASTITTAATLAITGPPGAGTNATITTSTPLLIDNDGIANTTKPGVIFQNTTAATSGASTQQWSPSIQLTGHQWSGAADKVVDWAIQHRPVSGKTNGGDLVFFSQYDAGGWTEQLTIQQNGTNTALELVLGGGSSPNVTFSGGATCLAAYFANRSDGSQNFVSVGSTSVTFSAAGSGSSTYTMDGTGFWPTQSDKTYQVGTSSKRFTQVWGYQYCGVVQTVADAASITVDPTAGETVRITLGATAITTVTVNNGQPGQLMTIEVIQDGTGSRTISGWSSNVKFAGGAAPTWTTTASKRDLVTFRWDSTDSAWFEVARSQNM